MKTVIYVFVEFLLLPFMCLACLASRLVSRDVDVGLGPEPLINNFYHQKALQLQGYKAETFVTHTYYITDKFDVNLSVHSVRFAHLFFFAFFYIIFRYKVVYIYFNGGGLFNSKLIWRIEPFLYKLAGVKTVVMPYGGDVQDLIRTSNLHFRHAVSLDYPSHRYARSKIAKKIDLWTDHADHVISGCDWVDYMHFWDTLLLAHFSIEVPEHVDIYDDERIKEGGPLRILHAPNHRNIKGTHFFENAVKELRDEGVSVELILIENVSNEEVRRLMDTVDIVADQLIVGWYAMFALEAMASKKPVICFLRDDLIQLYTGIGLLDREDLPIIRANVTNVKSVIRDLAGRDRESLRRIGERGREFVIKYHSLEAMGKIFDDINRRLGFEASN